MPVFFKALIGQDCEIGNGLGGQLKGQFRMLCTANTFMGYKTTNLESMKDLQASSSTLKKRRCDDPLPTCAGKGIGVIYILAIPRSFLCTA